MSKLALNLVQKIICDISEWLFSYLQFLLISFQSVVAKGLLTDISEKANYVPIMMNFSAQTSSQRTQEMIEVKLEKKRKNILGKKVKSNHFLSCLIYYLLHPYDLFS